MASLGFTDVVGLVGVAAYVSAHFGVQVLHKSPTGAFAVRLNLLGPACILISLMGSFNLASFLTQFFWLALTLMGWWRNKQAGRPVAEPASAPRPGQPAQL
ncbi:CBU_0592 family membrane protein [Ralstonia sp. 25C]|uniref:CBU_0592 family membrane protein n=1 Tax=Ralstonia sp. 25C TaxID=3447363 RepID=UPI003F74CB46